MNAVCSAREDVRIEEACDRQGQTQGRTQCFACSTASQVLRLKMSLSHNTCMVFGAPCEGRTLSEPSGTRRAYPSGAAGRALGAGLAQRRARLPRGVGSRLPGGRRGVCAWRVGGCVNHLFGPLRYSCLAMVSACRKRVWCCMSVTGGKPLRWLQVRCADRLYGRAGARGHGR